jgi:hypothetical protein
MAESNKYPGRYVKEVVCAGVDLVEKGGVGECRKGRKYEIVEKDGVSIAETEDLVKCEISSGVWVAVRRCEKQGGLFIDNATARSFVSDAYLEVKKMRTKNPNFDNENPVQYLAQAIITTICE